MSLKGSGMWWENEVFGCSSKEFAQPAGKDWLDAVEEVIACQGRYHWNPTNPRTNAGTRIYLSVKSNLAEEHRHMLEFYCAIGTALDWYYCTDGFFKIKKYIVCVDLTMKHPQQKKYQKKRNIVIITPRDDVADYQKVGQEIADIFNRELSKVGQAE